MSQIFDNVFAAGQQASGQIHAAITEWVRLFVSKGAPLIGVRMMAQDPCELTGCQTRRVAAVKCRLCRRTVCLGHVYLDALGDGVCYACGGRVVDDGDPSDDTGARAPRGPSSAELAAYAHLGLTHDASRKEVDDRVKVLRKKHHPDRATGAKAKAEATVAFKTVGQAVAVVYRHRGWT